MTVASVRREGVGRPEQRKTRISLPRICRAEQDWHPALRSLDGACALGILPSLAAKRRRRGTGSPSQAYSVGPLLRNGLPVTP